MFRMEILLLMTLLSIGLLEKVEKERILTKISVHARVKDAPFTVALVVSNKSGAAFNVTPCCTGTIIDPEWVLTAAHCIIHPKDPSAITIIAGADSIIQFIHGDVQKRLGKEIHIEPRYVMRRVANYDVAVVRVDKFEFNIHVNKATLWAATWVTPDPDGRYQYKTMDCQAYGWGQVDFQLPAIELRVATTKIGFGIDTCPCFRTEGRRRLVCTVNQDGYLCPGDFGGPLVCENNTVIGIAHLLYNFKSCTPAYYGMETFQCNNRDSESAWLYVCPMLRFIQHFVSSAPDQPMSCISPHSSDFSAVLLGASCLMVTLVFTV